MLLRLPISTFVNKSKIARFLLCPKTSYLSRNICEFFLRSSQDRLKRLQMTCRRKDELKLLIHLRSITGLSWQTIKLNSKRLIEEKSFSNSMIPSIFNQLKKIIKCLIIFIIFYYYYYAFLMILNFFTFLLLSKKIRLKKFATCVLCHERIP